MANRVGGAYSLTVIAPIVAGREDEARAAIEALPVGAEPLARLDGLHFSRIQVVAELVFQGPKQRHRDHLRSSQLVFTSTFDGALDPYLEALRACADTWWRFCAGYPGSATATRSWAGSAPTRSTAACSPPPTRRRPCRASSRASSCASGSSTSRSTPAGSSPAELQAGSATSSRDEAAAPAPVAADIDLADIQGDVLRGYTYPCAATCSCGSSTPSARGR